MEESELKKKYEALRKKYSLPSYEDIDFEFEISSIEDGKFLTREIIRKIIDKLDFYQKILEGLLQPDTNSLASMYECKHFDDKEKNEIYFLFKRLMVVKSEFSLLDLSPDEKKNSEFIIQTYKFWLDEKKKIAEIISKIKDSWKHETDIKEDLGYLG